MSEATATPAPTPEPFRQNLSALRNAVFELHKILIESERATYEQTVGTIPSPGYFLQLLTTDPWFAWLHPLSQMVVTMDVAEGQTVREGEVVCVIEAMKMQNIIRAEHDGVVKAVNAKSGDSVAADEVLVEFA